MFNPKKNKFKKCHKARVVRRVNKNLSYSIIKGGVVGLKTTAFGFITPKQLESVHQTVNKIIKKFGKLKIYPFPNGALSKKSKTATRMGKGKSKIDSWVYKASAGILICDISTEHTKRAVQALAIAKVKLPISTKIIFNKFK